MSPDGQIVSMPPNGDGWNEWRRYILITLREVVTGQDRLEAGQQRLETKMAVLKVKAGVWGLAMGAIPVVIGFGIWFLTK